jgi:hypothetical protein
MYIGNQEKHNSDIKKDKFTGLGQTSPSPVPDNKKLYKNKTMTDWDFTNKIHDKLAVPIYQNTGFVVEKATLKEDQQQGIDYFLTKNGKTISVQERFRTLNQYTKNSNEFTIRYTRPNSLSEKQKKSELFKIEADFLFYGIVNGSTSDEASDFRRRVLVHIPNLLALLDSEDILINENENNKLHHPYINKKLNKPVAIVKPNYEDKKGNSSLLIFDVAHLVKFFGKKIIRDQKGYIIPIEKENTKKPSQL